MRKNRTTSVVGLLLATVMTGACSGGATGVSPAGPSALVRASESGTTHNSTSSDSIVDRSRHIFQDPAEFAAWVTRGGWATLDGTYLEGTQTITEMSGACPGRVIMVGGAPGTLDANTVYQLGLTCEALAPGKTVFTKGYYSFNPGFFYDVDEICLSDLANPGVCIDAGAPPPPSEGYEEVTGTVGNLKGGCPTLSMVVHGKKVKTSGSTQYENGAACSDLRPGTKVVLECELEGDGSYDAVKVRITDQPGK